MKKLHFSSDGKFLFHSSPENTVDVWRVADGTRLCTCPGSLIGTSQDGLVLLTNTPAGAKAWETLTGLECEPATLSAERFEFHQRFYTMANRYKLVLELNDALSLEEVQQVRIEYDPRYTPGMDTWALAPDNASVVVTLSGEVAGEDWSMGMCIDLKQDARRFKFKVNKYQSILPLNFSREQNLLLVSDDIYHLAALDLETGRARREVWLSGFANVAVAIPGNPWLVATNVWEMSDQGRNSPFSIQVLNLERLSGERMQRARVEAVFAEPEALVDLECDPDGYHLASLLAGGTIHWWNMATGRIERTFEVINP